MTELIIPEKVILYVEGRAIPKPENDQNTDDIVPARFLREITFANMGKYVYADERARDGEKHPFNDPKYQGANILIAGANYGCGSSREHAPQALYRFGIRAIIAESFAEIFAGNCASLGLVGINMPAKNIQNLVETVREDPSKIITIRLEDEEDIHYVKKENGKLYDCWEAFEMPESRRQAFLNGTWDSLALLQQNPEEVEKVSKKIPYLNFK